MTTRTLPNPTFEVYASLRQEALTFLHRHALIPDMLYIAADGRIEAVYDHAANDDSILKTWQTLEQSQHLTLTQPLLPRESQLNVHFKLNEVEQNSFWHRIKRIVS